MPFGGSLRLLLLALNSTVLAVILWCKGMLVARAGRADAVSRLLMASELGVNFPCGLSTSTVALSRPRSCRCICYIALFSLVVAAVHAGWVGS